MPKTGVDGRGAGICDGAGGGQPRLPGRGRARVPRERTADHCTLVSTILSHLSRIDWLTMCRTPRGSRLARTGRRRRRNGTPRRGGRAHLGEADQVHDQARLLQAPPEGQSVSIMIHAVGWISSSPFDLINSFSGYVSSLDPIGAAGGPIRAGRPPRACGRSHRGTTNGDGM